MYYIGKAGMRKGFKTLDSARKKAIWMFKTGKLVGGTNTVGGVVIFLTETGESRAGKVVKITGLYRGPGGPYYWLTETSEKPINMNTGELI